MKSALRVFAKTMALWMAIGVLVFEIALLVFDLRGLVPMAILWVGFGALLGFLAVLETRVGPEDYPFADAADTPTDYDRQARAREDLAEWRDTSLHLFYCELCGQVFPSFDMFYDHREAGADERAWRGDGAFVDYRELTPGDPLPDGATVGAAEPCQPTDNNGGRS